MAIVNVWYPKLRSAKDVYNDPKGGGGVYTLVDNVGHASLTLNKSKKKSYVSWWPDKTHTSFATPSYNEDIKLEGDKPSTRTEIDFLDEDIIAAWWDRVRIDGRAYPWKTDFLPADNKWTLERNNCSHLVWLALKVGGAEKHASLMRWGAELVTPPQIHIYAERLKASRRINSLFR